MGKNKRVAAKQPKSMQEQLIALPKFADGGKVDPVEELLKQSAAKYGTGPAPTPEPPKPVAQPTPEQRGLASLPGKIKQRNDDLKRVMDYDKRPGMAAGGIAGIDKPISLQDTSGTRAPLPTFGAGAIGNSPMTAPVQNQIGGLDYGIAGPKQTGFLWSDGTRRDGLTPEQAQRQDAQQIAAPVAPATAPLLTMAEKQIAQGINPNAIYRPGGPGDPHASGGLAATIAQRAALPQTDQQQSAPQMPAAPEFQSRRGRARQFANGGMVKFSGKGGPREDKIPVKVAGADIRVSDGEKAVILPAKTAANPAAVQAIGAIIQQSNDGRAPDMGIEDGGEYRDGATPKELAAQLYEEKTGRPAPVGVNPLPSSRGVTGSWQNGASGDIPPVEYAGRMGAPDNAKTDPGKYPYTGQASRSPYQDASLSGMAAAVTPSPDLPTVAPVAPVVGSSTPGVSRSGNSFTQTGGGPAAGVASVVDHGKAPAIQPWWAGTDTRNESSGLEQERARAAAGQSISDNLRELNGPSMLTSAVLGDGAKQAPQPAVPKQASYSNEGRPSAVQQAIGAPDPRIAATTGNAGDAKFNADTGTLSFTKPGFDVTKQQVANGTGMISRANGQTQVIANMSPNQYTAADGTTGARWEETQRYKDAIARNEADKIRLAEMQATRQGMNPVQAIAATQGMAQAAQRAPLDRAVVQQQIETGKMAAQNANELRDLYAAHKAATTTDEQERIAEQIRLRTGKDKPEEFAHAAGGTTINPATMGVEKTPDVIYSKRTGKTIGAAPAAAKTFSKSDVDAAISAGASKEAVAARIKSMGMNPKDYGL